MVQKNREKTTTHNEVAEQSDTELKAAQEAGKAATEATVGKIDDILDEIDGVLESNAEEFVRAYVQKGGQ